MTELARTTYTPTDMHTGNVYASQLKLAVYGNGYWWWTGDLDDTSEVFGDNFAIGFSFEDFWRCCCQDRRAWRKRD